MEIFTIQVNGLTLTVFIQFNGVYSVFTSQYKLCDLELEYSHHGVWWKTNDLITSDYANEIGKAIEGRLIKKTKYSRLKAVLRIK